MYLKWAERQRCFNTKRCLVQQLAGVFGSYPLNSFTPRLIEEWQSELMHRLKPATCNRFLATLKHMFTKAVDWELTGEDTLRKVRKVKLLKENNRRLRFLSKEECKALVDACSPHLKPIIVTALNTGMRKGEILSLKWEQVDLRHGFVLLDNTKNGDCRQIPINSTLRATLEAIHRGPESEYVFTKNNGTPYKFVEYSFTQACRRAGITNFVFHTLRHTAASHMVMAGVDLATVKELLGHKTFSMTLRYSHLSSEHKANALKLLGNKIGNDGEDSKSCT
jgi:integrase